MDTTYDEALAVDAWMRAARTYLPPAPGRVLDLGGRGGRFSAALARTCGATVVACEPAEVLRGPRRSGPPPEVVVAGGEATALPFADAAFGAVWAPMAVDHVRDLPAFARELRRVLAADGCLLLRGGFGPAFDLPLYRYFPRAWAPGARVAPVLADVIDALGGVGLHPAAHLKVDQPLAEDAEELLLRVGDARSRAELRFLTDRDFESGVRELADDLAAERLRMPVRERLDLVVFRAAPRTRFQSDSGREKTTIGASGPL
jgi:SAM-dependent methyltransferase